MCHVWERANLSGSTNRFIAETNCNPSPSCGLPIPSFVAVACEAKESKSLAPSSSRKWLLGSFPEGPFGFPVIAIRFPVSSPEVPCYAGLGKASQLIKSQERRARKIRFSSAFLEIFPVISRKTGGKISDETGSYSTARAATQSRGRGDFLRSIKT